MTDWRARQLGRILSSKTLENAPSLRRLLEYLGEKALSGEADSLKEYIVGVEAFGKTGSYDPRSDASVRVQTSKLREKLDAYYGSEGSEDAVVVTLPKGHFKLEFRDRGDEPAPDSSAVLEVRLRNWRRLAFALGGGLVLAGVAAILAISRPAASSVVHPWTEDLETIWEPFLKGDRPVMLSLGTPMFLGYPDGIFRNPRLNEPNQLKSPARSPYLPDYIREPVTTFYDYTGIGEAFGAIMVSRALNGRGLNVHLRPSSMLSWEDIRRNNLIFIGAPKFNVHLRDLPAKQDFAFESTGIRNLRPAPGEPTLFVDTESEAYGLVSRLPGLQGSGAIMILAANPTEAVRAVSEYLTDPKLARDLVQQMKRGGNNVPKYFQAVIKGRFKSQVPVEIRCVTLHVLQAQ